MTPFGYIGIDFGTSNSHFAYCNCNGDLKPQTIPLAGKPSATTCVLWRRPAQEEADIVAYGTEALETWMMFEPEERARHYFAFGFKPDLAKSERARRDAWAFLLKAREDVRKAGLPRPIERGGMSVVVGVPAEIGEEHMLLTAEAARGAGFGQAECVEEPLGALAFHLNSGDITPAEARAGVLVVDFGGGTLDVALVNSEGLRQPWGDPMLGGRLFDDLFYQWVRDQNTPLEIDDREVLVVWQRDCRELKEAFSNRWRSKGDAMDDFKHHIFVGDGKKWLRNASVREFMERAKAYRPSPIVRNYFRGLDRPAGGLVHDAPIDLFDRIRRALTNNEPVGALRGKFAKVILTGGSSHWPFMSRRLATEALAVEEGDVILSQSPETTIGAGLALYNVLKIKNEVRRDKLRDDKPAAAARFRVDLAKRLDRFAEQAASAVVAKLMPPVEEAFRDWYGNGGSLANVEARIEATCEQFIKNREAEAALAPCQDALTADLMRLLRDHLKQFLVDHEIPKDVRRYVPDASVSLDDANIGGGIAGKIAGEVGGVAQAVAAATAGVVAVVVGLIKIKVLILLAVVHPILAALAGGALLLTLVFGKDLAKAPKEYLEKKIREYNFGKASLWVLHKVLWPSRFDKKLAEGRAEAEEELRKSIRASTAGKGGADAAAAGREPLEEVIARKFEAVIDLVIQDLGVLELVGSRRE